MPAAYLGGMRERLLIQTSTPSDLSVSSIARSGTTATVTTSAPHGFATGDYVTIAGASPSGYNVTVKITVASPTTFTYTVSSGLSTPATGTITATYASDAQGGRRQVWLTLDSVFAELIPLRATERLQAKAIGSQVDYRFRIRVRSDLSPKMRALWNPSWPPGATRKTLEIHGIVPHDDGRVFAYLECGELA